MHTWIRTDLLKDLESHFLRLNWPWFNGPLMRINPSMATLQLLGGDSETERAPRELNTLSSNTTKWPWPGLEIKMSLFQVQRTCHGVFPTGGGGG